MSLDAALAVAADNAPHTDVVRTGLAGRGE
jgi:hypothetical protein